jgi:hypothetical protein
MKNILSRIHLVAMSFTILLLPLVSLAHGISEADKKRMLEGGYLQYIGLGATHMLTGYDHLLFLFGVMFFLTSFKEIVKFITVFTIGHSITLIFATFYHITANYFLIDAFIALTVCYKGFDNIDGFKRYLEVNAPDLLKAVFLFGLIHGFGLSTRLQQLPLGEDKIAMFLRIVSFNVGVEIGQIIALSIMIAILAFWRTSKVFKRFSFAANSGLIFAGIVLLFMQLHGYMHNKYQDDFGFSQDLHSHAHQDMEREKLTEGGKRENLDK